MYLFLNYKEPIAEEEQVVKSKIRLTENSYFEVFLNNEVAEIGFCLI